jgi:ubiquinone/menaquinone biosynthesis C-methylase UbiE
VQIRDHHQRAIDHLADVYRDDSDVDVLVIATAEVFEERLAAFEGAFVAYSHFPDLDACTWFHLPRASCRPAKRWPLSTKIRMLCCDVTEIPKEGAMVNAIFDTEGAAGYYDDANVSKFYEQCWGGQDIHIGRYDTGAESVAEASAAMTRYLIERAGIAPDFRVLDIACGFGGTLRALARSGCQVRGIDISENCVERARKGNTQAGLEARVEVTVGDFHNIDSESDSWDAVICQEAIIHSPNRPKVFAEAYRVLRPGGVFAHSDILTGEEADISLVEAAFTRLGASAGATISDYQKMAQDAGFEMLHVEERLDDIRTHYDKLAQQLTEPVAGLDADAMASIAKSISNWQRALAHGHITWACFVARKPV